MCSRPRAKVLYVTAAGRSGSSIVEVLIGLHSHVAAAGEITKLPAPHNTSCPCGATVDRCPHWRSVGRVLGLEADGDDGSIAWQELPLGFHVATRPRTPGEAVGRAAALMSRKALERAARKNADAAAMARALANSWRVYDALSEATGSRWVTENSKTGGRLRALAAWEPKRVWGLHLVRDGRAVAASWMRRYKRDMRSAALAWMRMNLVGEAALRTLPADRSLRVRYEDVVGNGGAAIGRVFRFMGLDEEPVADRLAGAVIHSIPGSPSLHNLNPTLAPDLRWRGELGEADLATFERYAGWLNRRYGYRD